MGVKLTIKEKLSLSYGRASVVRMGRLRLRREIDCRSETIKDVRMT
jgi:hypothetical protein